MVHGYIDKWHPMLVALLGSFHVWIFYRSYYMYSGLTRVISFPAWPKAVIIQRWWYSITCILKYGAVTYCIANWSVSCIGSIHTLGAQYQLTTSSRVGFLNRLHTVGSAAHMLCSHHHHHCGLSCTVDMGGKNGDISYSCSTTCILKYGAVTYCKKWPEKWWIRGSNCMWDKFCSK